MIVREVISILSIDDVLLETQDVPQEDVNALCVGVTPNTSRCMGESLTINGRRFIRTREERATPHLWYDSQTFACVEINTNDERWAWLFNNRRAGAEVRPDSTVWQTGKCDGSFPASEAPKPHPQ